jgi:hypothetical protein
MNPAEHATRLGAEAAALAAATVTEFAQAAAEATPLAVEQTRAAALTAGRVALTEQAGAAHSRAAADATALPSEQAGAATAAARLGAGSDQSISTAEAAALTLEQARAATTATGVGSGTKQAGPLAETATVAAALTARLAAGHDDWPLRARLLAARQGGERRSADDRRTVPAAMSVAQSTPAEPVVSTMIEQADAPGLAVAKT